MIKGIDVASYQSVSYDITGLSFVVVKATEGTNYKNPRYDAQVKRARDNKLIVGHYHFVNSSASMDAQATYFVKTATEKTGEFLVLDWESPGVSDAEKNEFIKKVKQLTPTLRVGLYCNKDYWKNRDHSNYAGDFLWIADPDSPAGKPAIVHPWTIHQYSSAGGTDRNVANFGTRAAMAQWVLGSGAVKPPTAGGLPPAQHGTGVTGDGSTAPKPPAVKPVPKPTPIYAPYPGATFFKVGRKSPLITAMGKRLVAEGYKGYKQGPGPTFTKADQAAYAWWQKRLGYKGADANGIPGKTSWDKLKVPKG